jgi:hypothetical protein
VVENTHRGPPVLDPVTVIVAFPQPEARVEMVSVPSCRTATHDALHLDPNLER